MDEQNPDFTHGKENCASHKQGLGNFVSAQDLGVSERKVSVFTRRSERKSGYSGGRMGFLGVLIIERALASRRLTPRVVQL